MGEKGRLKRKLNKIIKMYTEERKSPYKIAKELGVTPSAIRYRLEASGIPLRGREEALSSPKVPGITILKKEYLDEGRSTYYLGQKYGIASTTIYLKLKKAGVPMRDYDEAKKLEADRKKPAKGPLQSETSALPGKIGENTRESQPPKNPGY